MTREPAGRFARRFARAAIAVALAGLGLAPPAAAAKPKCLGKVATIKGTSGDDTLRGTPRADVIAGLAGDDEVVGFAGNDLMCGGPGADSMFAVGGRDRLSGGPGRDQLSGGAGPDRLDGGGDSDHVNYYLSPGPVQVDLDAGTGFGSEGTDAMVGIENVFGSQFDDQITGDDGSNFITPFGGADVVDAGDELDIVFDGVGPLGSGTDGNDVLDGGDFLDAVAYLEAPGPVTVNLSTGSATGNGTDSIGGMEGIWGSAFDDILTGDAARNLILPGGGNDKVDGGAANDAAAFWFAQSPVTADTFNGTATGEGNDSLTAIEGLLGSVAHGDTLRGDDQTNLLDGDGGNDRLFGHGGDDWLTGGVGDDQIDGGTGTGDIVDFSTTAFFEVTAAVTVSLESRTASGQGNDTFQAVEQIYGSELGDTLTGDLGPNVLFGLGGDDFIFGGSGDDSIDAGVGSDGADGGPGTDQCINAESQPNCEGAATPPQHPALADAKVLEDYRRNFRRNF